MATEVDLSDAEQQVLDAKLTALSATLVNVMAQADAEGTGTSVTYGYRNSKNELVFKILPDASVPVGQVAYRKVDNIE